MPAQTISERPRWLAFYDLAMTYGAFTRGAATPRSSTTSDDAPEPQGTAGGLAALSAALLPTAACLEPILRL